MLASADLFFLPMNQTQRKSTARFFYDVAKVVVAIAVIGNIFAKDALNMRSLAVGLIVAMVIFFVAFFVERRVENEHG